MTKNRSACPYLNSMANCKYVNESGVFTCKSLIEKSHNIMNIDKSIINLLIYIGKWMGLIENDIIDLSDISKHNSFEHDVSLVHDDAYPESEVVYEIKRYLFNNTDYSDFIVDTRPKRDLFEKLVSFSNDGEYITLQELVKYHNYRIKECKKNNKHLTYGIQQKFESILELSALILLLGDQKNKIQLSLLEEFLLHERIPHGFKPIRNINYMNVIFTYLKSCIISFFV